MSDFSEAFAEVKRAVQPDVDPVLTKGDGTTPNPEMELDSIILASARATVWMTGAAVKYGDVIVPTVGNGRKYRVTTPGTLGVTEPSSWPDYDYGSVTSGTAVLEEDGRFVGSVYDVRAACYAAWNLKASKASQFMDVGSAQFSQIVDNCKGMRDLYRPVGVA